MQSSWASGRDCISQATRANRKARALPCRRARLTALTGQTQPNRQTIRALFRS